MPHVSARARVGSLAAYLLVNRQGDFGGLVRVVTAIKVIFGRNVRDTVTWRRDHLCRNLGTRGRPDRSGPSIRLRVHRSHFPPASCMRLRIR